CIQDASFSIDKKYSYLIDRLNCKCKNNTSLIYANPTKHLEYLVKTEKNKNRKRYVKTKEHILNIKKSIKRNKTIFQGKQVIDLSTGVFYSSIKQASFAYNLKYDTLKKYLDGRLRNR